MRATRTVPARPINDGPSVAETIVNLITQTLDRSPSLDGDLVSQELADAKPVLALLSSGGHLQLGDLVLVTPGLRLRIDVPTGEKAIRSEENTEPPRGAGSADDWTLHIPAPAALDRMVATCIETCPHLTTEPAPKDPPPASRKTSSAATNIDLNRLHTLGRER